MKKILLILSIFTILVACKNNSEKQEVTADELANEIAFANFGDVISETEASSIDHAAAVYTNIKVGDTIPLKFKAKVNEVCQSKGCWMKLDMGFDEIKVTFKDYGFFMPKNIAGEEVIVEGVAFIKEMSVEEQRHYAEDANKSEEEIAQITEPKKTYSFEARGVLLKE
jgi:hypothetical protein